MQRHILNQFRPFLVSLQPTRFSLQLIPTIQDIAAAHRDLLAMRVYGTLSAEVKEQWNSHVTVAVQLMWSEPEVMLWSRLFVL